MPQLPRIRRSWLGPMLVVALALIGLSAGAVASLETGTVGSFWKGLWWATSLMTTVGFIGEQPETVAGALVSVALMLSGFVLLAWVSAALASLFVKEDTDPFEAGERRADEEILAQLRLLSDRMAELESRLGRRDDS
ncbi:potassium channel family protein [Nocardioides mesophilus]|uniref:Two pore domain potassium channel family protein n=1 Tax=Nocardioides mesophilus TaxID=433659 RepID=A0A7G9RF21_9ACTN|nr:potassium channel family protein [Nocardioides mesophilus]QNN54196.1 two pore domain potassium channel family protein [Nocardioides mesophilus]